MSMDSMSGLAYDVAVPVLRRRPPALETQAQRTASAVRSKRKPRYVPFTPPPIRKKAPL